MDPLCFPNARWFMPQVDLTYLHEHWDEHKRSFPGDDWETVQRCEAAPEELAPGLKLRRSRATRRARAACSSARRRGACCSRATR